MFKQILIFVLSITVGMVIGYWCCAERNTSTVIHGDSMIEKTFAMIKPDAVQAKNSGKIIDMIEKNGFEIVGMRKLRMSKDDAEKFYAVHNKRPFFGELVEFITSGTVIVMALQKNNAIADWRTLMGATNPTDATEGTIRKLFGASIGNNAAHGSDAPETAKIEISQFFSNL